MKLNKRPPDMAMICRAYAMSMRRLQMHNILNKDDDLKYVTLFRSTFKKLNVYDQEFINKTYFFDSLDIYNDSSVNKIKKLSLNKFENVMSHYVSNC